MMEDEIVNEIHETRRRMFEECGNDLGRYLERIKAAEEQDKDRLVTFEEVQRRAREKRNVVRP
jgi:hypothetical protein